MDIREARPRLARGERLIHGQSRGAGHGGREGDGPALPHGSAKGGLYSHAVYVVVSTNTGAVSLWKGIRSHAAQMMKKLLSGIVLALLPAVALAADSPPATYIDKGACPFECCTYRTWHTKADTVAYATPEGKAKVVGLLKAGSTVEGITGEVHSTPGRFVVRKPHAGYKAGDVLWVYTYLGEGHFKVWRNGAMHEEDLGFSPYGGGSPGARCENKKECWGELEKELKFTWWVKVRSREGWEGWSKQPERFANKDACGSPSAETVAPRR